MMTGRDVASQSTTAVLAIPLGRFSPQRLCGLGGEIIGLLGAGRCCERMESLARRIATRLVGMNFFSVFEPEVSRVWPLDSSAEQERNKAIQAFAKERGWTANIHDPGIRVTFRKAKVVTG